MRACRAVALLLLARAIWRDGYSRGQFDALRASLAAESARIRATIEARQLLAPEPRRRRWSR